MKIAGNGGGGRGGDDHPESIMTCFSNSDTRELYFVTILEGEDG